MKVEPISANCILIKGKQKTSLQSYETVVVEIAEDGKTVLSKKWNCSNTTTKHVSRFLGLTSKEIKKRIASGEFTVLPYDSLD